MGKRCLGELGERIDLGMYQGDSSGDPFFDINNQGGEG